MATIAKTFTIELACDGTNKKLTFKAPKDNITKAMTSAFNTAYQASYDFSECKIVQSYYSTPAFVDEPAA